MDHATIDEQNLIELYLEGRLEPEVEARFEEHFLDCSRCQEELEMARGFSIGLRTVAAQAAASTAVATAAALRSGILARLSAWGRHRVGGPLLTAGLAFVAGALLFGGPGGKDPGPADPAAPTGGTPVAGTPVAGTPVFLLSTQRGESGGAAAIDLRTAREALILAVDVGDDARFTSYRVRVEGSSGTELWSRGKLLPNALETLMITFPPSYFEAGTFLLTLEGELPGGDTAEVGRYPFRVSPDQPPAPS